MQELLELSDEQKQVYEDIFSWLMERKLPFLTVGGYAGTGKTTLIAYLTKNIFERVNYGNIAIISYTGKATSILNRKLKNLNCLSSKVDVSTIHSLLYTPKVRWNSELRKMIIVGWKKRDELLYDLIIVDEASMISRNIFNDLISYGIPILFVGDNGQLPPIEKDGFNLMGNPHLMLNKIHRQAENNLIIKLSMTARNEGEIPFGIFDKSVFKLKWKDQRTKDLFLKTDFKEDVSVLCGTNKTRVKLNEMIRNKLKFIGDEPYPGERLICLKNNHSAGVMNGQTGTLIFLLYEHKDLYNMTIQMDGIEGLYSGLVYKHIFGQEKYEDMSDFYIKNENGRSKFDHLKDIIKDSDYKTLDFFDFGYATTVHKAQGSQWKKVVLFEEGKHWLSDYNKWLYTAVTRAEEKLFIIAN